MGFQEPRAAAPRSGADEPARLDRHELWRRGQQTAGAGRQQLGRFDVERGTVGLDDDRVLEQRGVDVQGLADGGVDAFAQLAVGVAEQPLEPGRDVTDVSLVAVVVRAANASSA